MTAVLMVAAENGALPGGKVGGIGDVIRWLPPAVANTGIETHVVLPAYGVFHEHGETVSTFSVTFAGSRQQMSLHRLDHTAGVTTWVLHHPLFGSPPGQIYHHDEHAGPYATDANLYALFCAGVAQCLRVSAFGDLDVVHLHDWHAATVLLFRNVPALRRLKFVYSVHNLALQGQRPLRGQPSALTSWFPGIKPAPQVIDPTYRDCYNPMRTGITLSDMVHTVSATYAREITQPNDPANGFHGGEGLEADLARAEAEGRLVGILNGCDYAPVPTHHPCGERSELPARISGAVGAWAAANNRLDAAHFFAIRNLDRVRALWQQDDKRPFLVTSVGRLVQQKVQLLLTEIDGRSVVSLLLRRLRRHDPHALMVVLGGGDATLEQRFQSVAAEHQNLVYCNGFSESLAEDLYLHGDLFLMPSSFEPCGISQMLAMRHGQPCLVHSVGGLRDTVIDDHNGFTFAGSGIDEQARNFIARFDDALITSGSKEEWHRLRRNARAERFTWAEAASRYAEQLYAPHAL